MCRRSMLYTTKTCGTAWHMHLYPIPRLNLQHCHLHKETDSPCMCRQNRLQNNSDKTHYSLLINMMIVSMVVRMEAILTAVVMVLVLMMEAMLMAVVRVVLVQKAMVEMLLEGLILLAKAATVTEVTVVGSLLGRI